jgi:hypothetical protein
MLIPAVNSKHGFYGFFFTFDTAAHCFINLIKVNQLTVKLIYKLSKNIILTHVITTLIKTNIYKKALFFKLPI